MEEDLKKLENMLNKESTIYKTNKRGNKEIKFEVNSNYYNAIEHLIQAYKQQADIIKNSVSKDKIKEKMKELDAKMHLEGLSAFSDVPILRVNDRKYYYKIQVLHELLEGDE